MTTYFYLALAAARHHAPGLIFAIVIAVAATFISEHQGGSSLLYALLLGMALKSVVDEETSGPGLNFAARGVLRMGVALLGLRISVEQVSALGWSSALVIVASVIITIAAGVLLARLLKFERAFGVLTGGATAICGASAALAISSLLPKNQNSERDASFTVVAVTSLATLAMIFFPPLTKALGFDESAAGFIFGGTIHDVAQVVGAGYAISPHAVDVATVAKLFRVALLIPVTLVIAGVCHSPLAPARRLTVPWFLMLFVAFALIRSLIGVPERLVNDASHISRWFFSIAIAAVGLKTSLGDFKAFGWQAVALVLSETLVITLLIFGAAFVIYPK
jgi:uncharacterized integral membrane protein (TIGR00698 family)